MTGAGLRRALRYELVLRRQALAALVLDAHEAVLAHPRHVVLAALVAGLLATPLPLDAVAAIALAAAALAVRPAVGALAAVAVVAGALGGQARLAAREDTALAPLLYTAAAADAILLEQPRPVQHGSTALAELRALAPEHGWAASGAAAAHAARGAHPADGAHASDAADAARGERVMLRIRSTTAWPGAATGAVVRVRGRLRALGPFEQHYARKGATAAITVEEAAATGARRGGVWRLVDGVRARAERALEHGLAPPQAALLRGMVLGQDEALDDRTRDAFRDSGLAHILAASGQNVALLLALALPLLTACGLGLRARLTAAIGLIALYVPLAGAGPSIQRAGVMGAATTAAALAGRPASRWHALLLAAAATLAYSPRAAADPGWQLSFAAVVAIALAARPAADRLRRWRLPGPAADAVGMTFAATLGTAPLLAFHFEQVSLASLPANVLAAPAIAPVMWLGMLAAAAGQVATALAWPLNALNAVLLGYIGAVGHGAAGLPLASVEAGVGSPLALAALYVLLGALVAALRSTNGPSIPGVASSANASPSWWPTSSTR